MNHPFTADVATIEPIAIFMNRMTNDTIIIIILSETGLCIVRMGGVEGHTHCESAVTLFSLTIGALGGRF